MAKWKRLLLLLMLGCALSGNLKAQQQVNPATITATSSAGNGYVTVTNDTSGVSAQIGRWDTPFPNGLNGPPAPGLEPLGPDTFYIDVDVNDGGIATFNYTLKSYDAGIYDWYDISLNTPSGTVPLVTHLGTPGSDFGSFYQTSPIAMTVKLTPWVHQHVQFVFTVEQDGYGDQTQGEVLGFGLRTCDVAPLQPLPSDPVVQSFEAGNTVDTADLQPNMQTALNCVQAAVTNAGGTLMVNSAYRPSAYQSHLREVWDKWSLLRDRRETECQDLRNQVQAEFNRHGLLLTQRPASANGPHTQGLAIDMQSSLPLQQFLNICNNDCGLYRPLPTTDPVHFAHQ